MKLEVLITGAGGQGIMTLGKIISNCAVYENKYTTYLPSYGAEVRGGSAYCFVKVSDKSINSPLIENPDIAIILNQASLDRFKKILKKRTILILNKDLISKPTDTKFCFPLNTMAINIGNLKIVNTIALGIFLGIINIFKDNTVIEVLGKFYSDKILEENIKAFNFGKKLIS